MWPNNMGPARGDDWATAIAGGSEQVVGEVRPPLTSKPTQARIWPAHRLRSSRQMLRQAIITSTTANAIAVANTVIIVANERTYITPYANVRNMLFPWTEKAPAIDGLGPVSTAIKSDPCFSADRARRFDTLRRAPGRPSAWAIRTASIPHHRALSAFRTPRTMPAESVGLALPA